MTIKDFIHQYIERGFGSMNKNDFEVFIFYWLLQNEEKCKDKSDFCISKYLKIPETKVKRLRYEASLKYASQLDEIYKTKLLNAISRAKCQGGPTEGKISLAIQDKMLRQYLSDMLANDGRFFDSSFNSNIVTLSAGDFVYILEQVVITKEDKYQIIERAKSSILKGKKLPQTLSETLKELGISFGKTFLEKVVGSSSDKLVDIFVELINQ